MRGTFISRLRAGTSNLIRDQRGNAMMLTAAMILPIGWAFARTERRLEAHR